MKQEATPSKKSMAEYIIIFGFPGKKKVSDNLRK
jgi:hypothetical protein